MTPWAEAGAGVGSGSWGFHASNYAATASELDQRTSIITWMTREGGEGPDAIDDSKGIRRTGIKGRFAWGRRIWKRPLGRL